MNRNALKWSAVLLAAALVIMAVGVAAAADYKAFVQDGDRWFAERKDLAKAKKAVEAYRKAFAAAPDQPETSLKLAEALYFVGINLPKGADLPYYKEALDMAKKAAWLAPDNIAAHYRLGVMYGLYGNAKGVMASVRFITPLKEEMEKVIQMDPAYKEGGAYRVLGRVYLKLPAVLGGSEEKAESHLKTALKYGPDNLLNHLYLADLYREQGRLDEAGRMVRWVIDQPCPAAWPECDLIWKKEARKMLGGVEKPAK